MFLRISALNGRRYLQIAHSYRDGKRTKQRLVATLGRFEQTRYCHVKALLKDWVRMDRAPGIIAEIKGGEPYGSSKRVPPAP